MNPTPTFSEKTPGSDGDNKLNTAAIIGIAIGGIAGCLILLLLGVFIQRILYRRRSQHDEFAQAKMHPRRQVESPDYVVPGIGELGTEMTDQTPKSDLDRTNGAITIPDQMGAHGDGWQKDDKAYAPYRKPGEGFVAELAA